MEGMIGDVEGMIGDVEGMIGDMESTKGCCLLQIRIELW